MIRLAILIALIALLDAAVGVAERWQSSKIGEGLILDLRRAVFGHVQRMPVAFFTRTRTGALVSRLNNDVIGAQRAFTWTLSGVVSNLIALVLTLAVMLRLSWQITAPGARPAAGLRAAGPPDGCPAGPPRAGGGRPQLGDDHADDRALLGAGRHPGEAVRPARLARRPSSAARAERVAEIGVRTAMGQYVFLTALALVSALALALVYGLGGYLALQGRLEAGHRRHPRAAAHPPLRAAHRPGQRPGSTP